MGAGRRSGSKLREKGSMRGRDRGGERAGTFLMISVARKFIVEES